MAARSLLAAVTIKRSPHTVLDKPVGRHLLDLKADRPASFRVLLAPLEPGRSGAGAPPGKTTGGKVLV